MFELKCHDSKTQKTIFGDDESLPSAFKDAERRYPDIKIVIHPDRKIKREDKDHVR